VPKKERQAPEPPPERDYGPPDRQLLEADAAELFEAAVRGAGVDPLDERVREGGPWHAAFELLVSLGLLAPDSTGDRYLARDPAGSQAQVVAPLSQRGAELIAESSRWATAFGALSQTWRRSPVAAHGPFTELHDHAAINKFIDAALDDATFEILTAQPQTGRALDQQLVEMSQTEIAALERGVAVRTLYQHAARRNSSTHKYVRTVTRAGGEVRTLDEFFNRLIVFDRALAVIPGAQGTSTAVVVREPSVVAYLVDVYERAWERSRPFANQESDTMRDIAGEQRAMTIRMLIQGYADPASSKRLGVSPRTFAGYVADLKTEFDAETRFQLGYYMGQHGITGDDPSELNSSARSLPSL
jgi:hypothetical protein